MTTDKEIHKTFRFRNFQVYKDARALCRELKPFSKRTFPEEERFGLLSQLWRALDSIILNIAEGADRATDKDFALFLNRSHTSLSEVVSCLDIALDMSYITTDEHGKWICEAAQLADQLTAFRKYVLSHQK